MTAGWVAAAVRARALARQPCDTAALTELDPQEQERALATALLWSLRVLAGWVPRGGVVMLRDLAAWFEIADVEARLTGTPPTSPYRLGPLATGGTRLQRATGVREVRSVLATSPWGDPGVTTVRGIGTVMRARWAARVAESVPLAAPWAVGGAALLLARERRNPTGELPAAAERPLRVLLSTRAVGWDGGGLAELVTRLPRDARWVFDGIGDDDAWRAEARWWSRVAADARELLTAWRPGPEPVIGAVAALGARAWETRAKLGASASGATGREVLDALA